MATAARDRLARTLRGDAKTAFSAELTARTGDLSLEIEGFGPVKLPVTPARARKLLSLGQPARFGRGEETLTDPDVRDTWEIPKHLVRTGAHSSGRSPSSAGSTSTPGLTPSNCPSATRRGGKAAPTPSS